MDPFLFPVMHKAETEPLDHGLFARLPTELFKEIMLQTLLLMPTNSEAKRAIRRACRPWTQEIGFVTDYLVKKHGVVEALDRALLAYYPTDTTEAIVQRIISMLPGGTPPSDHALSIAAWRGPLSVVKLLLDHGAVASANESAAMFTALRWRRADVVELLLGTPNTPAQVSARAHNALMYPLESGDVSLLRLLLSAPGAYKANDSDSAILGPAIMYCKGECIKALLSFPHCPAEADAMDSAYLAHAAERLDRGTVQLLLRGSPTTGEHAARADAGDSRALIKAVRKLSSDPVACADVVRELLSAPTHPAHADAADSEALVAAVVQGDTGTIAGMLLSAPTHPAQADAQGGAALQLAARNGNAAMVRLLLRYPMRFGAV